MPFRGSEYKERCGVCGVADEANVADEVCPRCRQPTCGEHRAADLLCATCEEEYQAHEEKVVERAVDVLTTYISVACALTFIAICGVVLFWLARAHPGSWVARNYTLLLLAAIGVILGSLMVIPDRALKRAVRRRVARRMRSRFVSSRG